MDQKKPSGFSLFPQPPTPPARKSRTRSTSSGTNKLFKTRPSERAHGRMPSTCTAESTPPSPGLVPAPLKIRKSDEDIPPLPPLTTTFVPATPVRNRRERNAVPKTPEHAPIRIASHVPQTPSRRHEVDALIKPKPRAVSDYVELEASNRRRASTRLSQWLDLEDGEIDKRRLSMYLGSVLDNTFEVPTFEPAQLRPITPHRRKMSKSSTRPPTGRCDCPPSAIICHCSSSPEFERFNNWAHHKQSPSISSTTCILGVPRARFQSAFYHIPEPSMAELPSPPGLTYDDDDDDDEDGNTSDMDEWMSPVTPSRNDIFTTPSSRSYSSKCVVSTSTSLSGGQSRFQSFSRPFRPESTYRSMAVDDSAPSTPSRKGRSKTSGTKFLKSISTLSSFEFAFDFSSMGQSGPLTQQRYVPAELSSGPIDNDDAGKDQSNHARTESNESFTSQVSHVELSTATATVARTGSGMKPALVTNTAKRTKPPSSNSSADSSTRSSSHFRAHSRAKPSTSASTASSDLRSWHTAYERFASSPEGSSSSAHSRPSHARSGTTATNTSTGTTGSTGLTALLHMPLLIPKRGASAGVVTGRKASSQRRKKSGADVTAVNVDREEKVDTPVAIVSGNAFARSKSNPMPLLNPLLSGAGKEVVHGSMGPNQSQNQSQHSLAARSNTCAAQLSSSSYHRAASTNTTIPVSPDLDHSSTVSSRPRHRRGAPSRSGLRIGTSSGSHRMSNYLYVDDRRDDSGVFGYPGGGGISPVSSAASPLPAHYLDDINTDGGVPGSNRLAVPTWGYAGPSERESYVSSLSSATLVRRSGHSGGGGGGNRIGLDIAELGGGECECECACRHSSRPEHRYERPHGYGYGHGHVSELCHESRTRDPRHAEPLRF